MSAKVFVVGSLNMDLAINAPYMPENGVTLAGSGFLRNPGGKGANQAAAVGKLGGEAYMVGCVGEAFGEELIGALAGYGVHTEFVERIPESSSGIAMIVVVDGDNRIFLDAGANANVSEALVDRALARASGGDILAVQLETKPDVVAYALRRAKEKGLLTILNPAPAQELPESVWEKCDFIVPNQSEAEFYTGVRTDSEAGVRQAGEIFKRKGAGGVILTLGARGAYFTGGGESFFVRSRKVKAVDTTAAGDTYVGAFATMLSEGASVAEAMAFAARAAAVTVTRRGAQQAIPLRSEVK